MFAGGIFYWAVALSAKTVRKESLSLLPSAFPLGLWRGAGGHRNQGS